MKFNCPACESGVLARRIADESFLYDKATIVAKDVEFSACQNCGEEVVLPTQAKKNDLAFADARRLHDGLLTSSQIQAWRRRWRLTQQAASDLLGGGPNAFSKYERGKTTQSKSMDLLMQISDSFPQVWGYLSAKGGVDLPGREWESFASASDLVDEPEISVKPFSGRGSGSVDVAALRVLVSSKGVANEGQWRDEPVDGCDPEPMYA